jgi:hypothetical protein
MQKNATEILTGVLSSLKKILLEIAQRVKRGVLSIKEKLESIKAKKNKTIKESISKSEIINRTMSTDYMIPDNCPQCKNPNTQKALTCEWCGSVIEPVKRASDETIVNEVTYVQENSKDEITLVISWGGAFATGGEVKVTIDGIFIGQGSQRKGFELRHTTTNLNPKIVLQSPLKTNIDLKGVHFELGEKYQINLDRKIFSMTGFSSKPHSIIKLSR